MNPADYNHQPCQPFALRYIKTGREWVWRIHGAFIANHTNVRGPTFAFDCELGGPQFQNMRREPIALHKMHTQDDRGDTTMRELAQVARQLYEQMPPIGYAPMPWGGLNPPETGASTEAHDQE